MIHLNSTLNYANCLLNSQALFASQIYIYIYIKYMYINIYVYSYIMHCETKYELFHSGKIKTNRIKRLDFRPKEIKRNQDSSVIKERGKKESEKEKCRQESNLKRNSGMGDLQCLELFKHTKVLYYFPRGPKTKYFVLLENQLLCCIHSEFF